MVIGLALSGNLVMLPLNDEVDAVSQVQPIEKVGLLILMKRTKITETSMRHMDVM